MIDPESQQRFARHCTEAAFGYSAATTAAYAAFADQVMNFWTSVLQPPQPQPKSNPVADLWRWPVPLSPPEALGLAAGAEAGAKLLYAVPAEALA